MELNRMDTDLSCYQLVYQDALRREESVDSVVPDTLPDIGAVLCTCGTPLIRSKDIGVGKLRLEANIPVKVLYRPEDGSGVRQLDLNIPFSVTAEDPELGEDCVCTADIRLAALETKMLNPRKITVRAELCFAITCYRAGSTGFFRTAEGREQGVRLLEQEIEIAPVCAVTEKTFVLTDEYSLAAGKPTAAQILCQKTQLSVEELKTVGSKIIVKGSAKSCITYLTAEGIPAAETFFTGFSQIVEAERLPEDAILSAVLLLSGAYYDIAVDSAGRTIGMELHLVAQLTAREKKKIRYLSDAYSNLFELLLCTEQREVSSYRRETALRGTLRELAETPVPVAVILSACAEYGCPIVSGDTVTVPVTVQVLYLCSAGLLRCARRSFSLKLPAELAKGERLQVADVELGELFAVPADSGLELRLPVEVRAFVFSDATVTAICGVSLDTQLPLDLSDLPSLILREVASDETLWDIAKEYHSTVEAIREWNALAAETEPWKRLLLIPKTLL